MRSFALALCVAIAPTAFVAPARAAQEPSAEEERIRVELRVLTADPGAPAVIDRGAADGVAVGDVVWIEPRAAARQRAAVVSVEERSAAIRFVDARFRPEPGARGEVLVPASRLALEEPAPAEPREPVPAPVELPIHTTSSGPGAVARVDRGSEHGLAVGDPVRFPLPGGGATRGVVTQLGNATAVVEFESGQVPATGARGEALLPRARVGGEEQAAGDAHPGWENPDEEWTAGMPLLSQARAVRPADRPRSFTGLGYLGGQYRFTNDADRSDSFTRLGAYVLAENPFGAGGAIQFDAEFNYRTTELPYAEDEAFSRTRLDRLSYRHGGTRFAPTRWEAGRFLQNGVPEFGVLDGGEVVRRRKNGDRFGASAGYIADPLLRLEGSDDLQFAGFYELNLGERNPLSLTAGYQKTFHNRDSDRDLVVTKIRFLPRAGWDFQGTAWVDFYTDADVENGSGPDLSQLWLTTQRAFASGDGIRFGFRHLRRPELLSDELPPTTMASLADQRYDRLWGNGTVALGTNSEMRLESGVWNDETESGGDASIGFELRELFVRGGRGYLTAFATSGQFSQVLGGRISYGRVLPRGQWELYYELSDQRQDGFSSDRDDIVQHRLRASRDFYIGSRWTLSVFAEGVSWDDYQSVNLAFFLQRSF